MKRRDLLKTLPIGAAAAAVPFSLPGLLGNAYGRSPLFDALLGADPTDRVLVLINMAGGNDGLNTVIPYQDPNYDKNRADVGFVSSKDKAMLTATQLTSSAVTRQDLALNPSMNETSTNVPKNFMQMFKDGKVAVVQNVGYPDPNLSHFRSTDIWNTASDSNTILETGWIGRYLESHYPNYPLGVNPGDDPIAIEIGGSLNPVFQGSRAGMGLAVYDPSKYTAEKSYSEDPAPPTNAGAELTFVRNIFIQSDSYGSRFTTLFPPGIPPPNKVVYPGSSIAQQLKKVAWCISKGMKTKVYFVQMSGFDTHINQNAKDNSAGQGQLLSELANAIAAFQADLEAFNIADRVIGMTYSEFGRRVNQNASFGTDHGTCAPQFLFGSQINGEVYGSHPDLVNLDGNGDLIWKYDFRQLYASVLGDWFGLSQPLRKAILMDTTQTGERFNFDFTVDGTSKKQSLIRNPAEAVQPSRSADSFVLYQNYPNPFNPSTTIRFALSESQPVTLRVFNSRGEKIKDLFSGRLGRGEHQLIFDASRLTSGTYYYKLEAGQSIQTRQMTLLK